MLNRRYSTRQGVLVRDGVETADVISTVIALDKTVLRSTELSGGLGQRPVSFVWTGTATRVMSVRYTEAACSAAAAQALPFRNRGRSMSVRPAIF